LDFAMPIDATPAPRKPRLLWANLYCLLDTASGASMTVREMLLQLVGQGYEVRILGAAVFDHVSGTVRVKEQWEAIQARRGRMLTLVDGPLEHQLLVTGSTRRAEVTAAEENRWFATYQQVLDQFNPDLVFFYGGNAFDHLISAEARVRGIPSAFYLANGNYNRTRWCRDVDLILTDSQATADRYARELGCKVTPVGKFIDPSRVVAQGQTRERILFVNPRLEKGVAIVIRLALLLEKRRPDIVFEVVESRGQWPNLLRQITAAMGHARESLDNVVVTPNTDDMRPVYGRARLLLAPSLWWESGGRVVVEAMLNGIPALITDYGGMAEFAGDAGITLKLAPVYHEPPYTRVPEDEALEPLLARLEALYDDEAAYAELVSRAWRVGQTRHSLAASTQRLLQALQPWVEPRAGDQDTGVLLRQVHKQGLDDRLPPPLPTDSSDRL